MDKLCKPNKTILPYNKNLVALAKENRKNLTQGEIYIWNRMKGKQIEGFDFDRQKPILNYIVDFFCNELMLAVEIDGGSHRTKEQEDEKRQMELEELGLTFLRFTEWQAVNQPQNVIDAIKGWIFDNHSPTPAPSQEGRHAFLPSWEGAGVGFSSEKGRLDDRPC